MSKKPTITYNNSMSVKAKAAYQQIIDDPILKREMDYHQSLCAAYGIQSSEANKQWQKLLNLAPDIFKTLAEELTEFEGFTERADGCISLSELAEALECSEEFLIREAERLGIPLIPEHSNNTLH